jgi:hypothetical protein
MGVALVPQKMGVEWGMARLTGVAVAELNNTVHLCSNQGCTVDISPKIGPSCFEVYNEIEIFTPF